VGILGPSRRLKPLIRPDLQNLLLSEVYDQELLVSSEAAYNPIAEVAVSDNVIQTFSHRHVPKNHRWYSRVVSFTKEVQSRFAVRSFEVKNG